MNGLSIHFTLASTTPDAHAIRSLVEEMRRLALRQAVERVGPVIEVLRPYPIICFPVLPGMGCEIAAFGFCKLAAVEGWRWSYTCCTQPASRPEHGGLENFLRCHQALIGLLDAIRQAALATVEVRDDGGYWQHRDQTRLAEAVRLCNGVDLIFPENE
jgi:hypothetical protein